MIAPLAKFIDWSALQMAYVVAGLRHAPRPKWKLEEALEFLNGPDFIPAESQPAQLDFGPDAPGGRFRFPTPRPGEFAENNVVHGRLLDRTPLNLTLARPAISKENVLLIEGMYDLMGWGAAIELWQSWGQPEIWRLPHGHISTAITASMPGLLGRVLRWLEPRLNNTTTRTQNK